MKKHKFGIQPTKIVWIQLAGLDDQVLSLIKFNSRQSISNFEGFTCYGRSWGYNLFNLRPGAYSEFLSEITGKKNIQNKCLDYKHQPIWQYLSKSGYTSAILENPVKKTNSLIQASNCEENNFLTDTTLFLMSRSKKENYLFHYAEDMTNINGGVFYDRSCKKGKCYTSILENAVAIYENYLTQKNENHFLLIRDFSFEDALKKNLGALAQKKLIEYNMLINYFNEVQKNDKNMLLIVSSGSPVGLDLPKAGESWSNLSKLKYKQRLLNSPVFTSGARAENFCGIYEKAQILPRLLSEPKDLGLEYKFYNPFR